MQKMRIAPDLLTALCGDDAAKAQADILDTTFEGEN